MDVSSGATDSIDPAANANNPQVAVLQRQTSNQEARSSRVQAAFSYAILLGGIITIVLTIYMVVASYSALPWGDGWAQIDPLANGINPLSLQWLWGQHDEHRLVIPKLFLLADLHFFRARQVFLLISILVIQFIFLSVLSWSMRALGGWPGSLWRTGTGIAAFCLFCPTQWHNFVWGFETCFVLPGLFLTLSFIGLLLYWRNSELSPAAPRWRFLALSILAAVGATCSLANGNLVWPLLVLAALFLRLKRSTTLTLAIAGTASFALYFFHYVSPTAHGNALSVLQDPARFPSFLAVYLGSSFVHADQLAAEFIGLAGIVILCWLLPRSRSFVQTRKLFRLQMILTLLFCIGAGIATALGRSNFGLGYAFTSRYQTVALLFWCALGLLLLDLASTFEPRRAAFLLTQLLVVALMIRGALLASYPIGEARDHGFQLNVASMALLTGVYDGQQFSTGVGVKPGYLRRVASQLEPNGLSVYSWNAQSQLGKPVNSLFRMASADECEGELQQVKAVETAAQPALRISGWAWDIRHQQLPLEIIATTEGTVTGLAAPGGRRASSQETSPWKESSYSGYAGYVRDAGPATPLEIYAVLRGDPPSACPIASSQH